MQTKTVLSQLHILAESRHVIAHYFLVVYDDAGVEIARSKTPHTVTFTPDQEHDEVLAMVNADITTREGMKWPAIDAQEIERIGKHCSMEHTPEVKRLYKEHLERAEERRLSEAEKEERAVAKKSAKSRAAPKAAANIERAGIEEAAAAEAAAAEAAEAAAAAAAKKAVKP